MDHSSCQIKQTIFANPNKELEIPTIYACATMWHETKAEMMELNKSLFRMDQDQLLLKEKNDISGKIHQNFYKFESKHFQSIFSVPAILSILDLYNNLNSNYMNQINSWNI